MPDGPLSQDEIDALLQGVGTVPLPDNRKESKSGSLNKNENNTVDGDAGERGISGQENPEFPEGSINKEGKKVVQEALPGEPVIVNKHESIRKHTVSESFKNKLMLYSEAKGKKRFKSKNIISFYNESLDPDEKRFISGDLYGSESDGGAMKKIIGKMYNRVKQVEDKKNDPVHGDGPYAENFRFPVILRVDDGTVAYEEISRGTGSASIENMPGRKASLVIGNLEIAAGRISFKDGERPCFEISDTVIDRRSGDFSLIDFLLGYPLSISVEAGRKNITVQESEKVSNGSVLVFDKCAGEPLDIILDGYGTVIAKGEACILGEMTAVRITEMLTGDIVSVINSGPVNERAVSSSLIVPVRSIYGRRKLTLNELLGLGEGSVLELERNCLLPAELELGRNNILRADIVVIDDKMGARVPAARMKNLNRNHSGDNINYASSSGGDETGAEAETVEEYNSPGIEVTGKYFAFFNKNNIEHAIMVLQGEHPQAIALVLSCLEAELSGIIISLLPYDVRLDVTRRIVRMKNVSSRVLKDIEHVLERKFSGIGDKCFKSGGVDFAVDIIRNTDRGTGRTLIQGLEETDREAADEIKKKMFLFENIVFLEDRSVQKVLREVDTQDLAIALKGASHEVQEKIFANMSKRAGSLLREDMEFMGPMLLVDVEKAQNKIIDIIHKLEEAGEIIVLRQGEYELTI